MRICLATRYLNFKNAGLGRVGMEILKGLVQRKHSVRTVHTNGNSLYSYFFYTSCQIPFKLPKDADVYHAITPMEGMWLPKGKSIVTFHDLMIITNPDKLGSGIGYSKWKNLIGRTYNQFAVNVSKNCAKITAVSQQTKDDLIEYLRIPEEKITVIRSGIRPDLVPLGKKDKVFRVGYLGQLDRRKRVHLLIEAFKRSGLDELVIGGIGLDEPLLRKLADGDKRIKFLGLLPDNRLSDFYNSLNVFVFPTWLEGYGLPIVEAMACKKPVIVLGDAGIPWDVKKRCAVVGGLKHVLGNQKYLEGLCKYLDIEGNYQWAKEHDWGKAVDQYIALYQEIRSA